MALVITRNALQSFTIGDDIKVTIVDIYNQNGHLQAKVAIDAPKHMDIKRDDIVNNQPNMVRK